MCEDVGSASDPEVDGAYFGGHVRPANRVDRRLVQHQTGKRRVVVIMRERSGHTLPFVFTSTRFGTKPRRRYLPRPTHGHEVIGDEKD